MPNAQTDTERSVRYLTAAFQLNPLLDADRILKLRAKFLCIEPPRVSTASDFEDVREARRKASVQLELIRRNFWKADIGRIRTSLDQLKLDRHPDLRLARDRLKSLADHRHEFGQLASRGIADPEFFSSLREILVAAPRVAATERDALIASIRSAERLKKIHSMIRTIRKQMPAIFELEADWLETILRIRKRRVRAQQTAREKARGRSGFSFDFSGFDFGGFGWLFFLLLVALVRMAIRIGFSE